MMRCVFLVVQSSELNQPKNSCCSGLHTRMGQHGFESSSVHGGESRLSGTARQRIFNVEEVLGSGGAGVIYRATTSKRYAHADKDEVAIKAVRISAMSQKELRFLYREIAIHRAVQHHPHVCGFYNHFSDKSNMYIILESLRGGDILSLLRKTQFGFDECSSLTIISQVLDVLTYLHERGIAHRDIKPENIMMSDKVKDIKSEKIHIKLIDFGLASFRRLSTTRNERMSVENVGTIRYAAPEIMKEEPYFPEESDIWSTGVTLFTLIARKNPFLGDSNSEVLCNVEKRLPLFEEIQWRRISEETKKLIKDMLSPKGADRPSAKEARDRSLELLNKLQCSKDDLEDVPDSAGQSLDGLRMPKHQEGHIQGELQDLAENGEDDDTSQTDRDPENIVKRIREFLVALSPFGGSTEALSSLNNNGEDENDRRRAES